MGGAFIVGMAVFGGIGTIWRAAVLFLMTEGLRFVGVVYNRTAVSPG